MSEKEHICNGNHPGHICVLASKEKFDEIRELTYDPQFICFNCGRVAHSEKNLCDPMSNKQKV